MDLTKSEIRGIAKELQGITDEKEFEKLLDKWWEGKMQMQKKYDAIFAEYTPDRKELDMFAGAYLTEYQYNKINKRAIYDKDMIELRGRKIGIIEEDYLPINENSLKCIKKILKTLKVLDLFCKSENGYLYFEGRVPKLNKTDDYEYEFDYEKESNIYLKEAILEELIYLWFESKNAEREIKNVDFLDCKKTEYILLNFLPVFNINEGNKLKEYDEYKRDVYRIRNALKEYEKENVKTISEFENQIKILLTPKMADKLINELINLNGRAKKLFYAYVIGRIWNSVKDVIGLAKIYKVKYMDDYKPKYEKLMKNKEMSDINKKINLDKMEQELTAILNYSNIQGIREEEPKDKEKVSSEC